MVPRICAKFLSLEFEPILIQILTFLGGKYLLEVMLENRRTLAFKCIVQNPLTQIVKHIPLSCIFIVRCGQNSIDVIIPIMRPEYSQNKIRQLLQKTLA